MLTEISNHSKANIPSIFPLLSFTFLMTHTCIHILLHKYFKFSCSSMTIIYFTNLAWPFAWKDIPYSDALNFGLYCICILLRVVLKWILHFLTFCSWFFNYFYEWSILMKDNLIWLANAKTSFFKFSVLPLFISKAINVIY